MSGNDAGGEGPAGLDPRLFRTVLGHFPTSVVAITAAGGHRPPAAMVVGTFASVSLDPPLVSFLADRSSTTLPHIVEAGVFCANAFASDQEQLCRSMAKRRPDRLAGVPWTPSLLGNPALEGVVARVDCVIERVVTLGDHELVVGAVRHLEAYPDRVPLLFFQAGFGEYYSSNAVVLERMMSA